MRAGDKVSASADAERKGVHFDLQDIFEQKLKQPSCTQVSDNCFFADKLIGFEHARVYVRVIKSASHQLCGSIQSCEGSLTPPRRRSAGAPLHLSLRACLSSNALKYRVASSCEEDMPNLTVDITWCAAVGMLPRTQAGVSVFSPQRHAVFGQSRSGTLRGLAGSHSW